MECQEFAIAQAIYLNLDISPREFGGQFARQHVRVASGDIDVTVVANKE